MVSTIFKIYVLKKKMTFRVFSPTADKNQAIRIIYFRNVSLISKSFFPKRKIPERGKKSQNKRKTQKHLKVTLVNSGALTFSTIFEINISDSIILTRKEAKSWLIAEISPISFRKQSFEKSVNFQSLSKKYFWSRFPRLFPFFPTVIFRILSFFSFSRIKRVNKYRLEQSKNRQILLGKRSVGFSGTEIYIKALKLPRINRSQL